MPHSAVAIGTVLGLLYVFPIVAAFMAGGLLLRLRDA
jgi:hypothetical protein